MSNPFDQFDPQPTGAQNPFDQFDKAPPVGSQLKRAGGLLTRSLLDTAAGLPLAALEGGAGVANLVTGGNFSPRRTWNEGLDAIGLPRAETGLEKVSDVGVQMLAGSRIPAPTGQAAVPANFKAPTSLRTQVLEQGQKAGYVVPPTTTNPTVLNRTLEGMAGKLTTAQMASAKNTEITNSLAKKALNLSGDSPITLEALQGLRAEAGQAYAALKGIGTVTADDAFKADLSKVVSKYQGAGKDFPTLARADLQSVVDDLAGAADTPKQFDSGSAVDAIAVLREKSDAAFAAGDKAVGKAYREFAGSMENLLERNLSGDKSALEAFRAARQLIAKTYSVEKALNQSTGNVSATKLAQQLAKGKPLSAELKQAAQFGQAFPKATRDFNESLPGISPLDFYAAGGITAMTQKPWSLLYPFIRVGTRAGLLSQGGQRLAVPSAGMGAQPGMATGAGVGLSGLLGY
jgi:hypothetical protein